MKRVAAAKFDKHQPESDWASRALPPARRSLGRQKVGRATPPRYRAGFGPHPRQWRARSLIRGRPAKQVERAWEVVDDFPEDIPVMPRELKVIETYLAALLHESLEPTSLEAKKAAIESVKPDVE